MRSNILIFLILIFSLILNLYGIKWGLPNKNYPHPSFHPDETASLESSLSILDPNRTLYPSSTALGNGAMQFYLVAIVYKIGQAFGFLKSQPVNYADLESYYLTGRIVTVIMSVLMIYFVFLITRIMFGTNVALLASMFLASMPGLVADSHYFRPEAPAAFWIVLSLFFAVKIVQTKQIKFYLLAAMSAGFAASTKYNSVFAILLIIAAHIISLPKKKRNFKTYLFDKKLIYSYLIVIAAFFVGSIGILFYFDEFKLRLLKQLAYQRGSFGPSTGLGPSWLGYFTYILPCSLSLPLLILSTLGFVFALVKRCQWNILLLIWTISYYILMSSSTWWVVRYTVPLLPPLAILAANFIFNLPKSRLWKITFLVIGLIIALGSFTYSLILVTIMAAKDPRIAAYDWIQKNVPRGEKLGIDLTPAAFYVPADEDKYQIVAMQLNESKLAEINYYIANDLVYQYYLQVPQIFPVEIRYFKKIFLGNSFAKVATFKNTIQIFSTRFPRKYLPIDYLFIQPTISIFKRVEVDTLK